MMNQEDQVGSVRSRNAVCSYVENPLKLQKRKYVFATDLYSGLSDYAAVEKMMFPYFYDDIQKMKDNGETTMTVDVMTKEIICPREWSFVNLGGTASFYFSRGVDGLFRLENNSWTKTDNQFKLSANTLVYAEIVEEFNSLKQQFQALHIIDGLVVAGRNIRDLSYPERLSICSKYATLFHKHFERGKNFTPNLIRAKRCRSLMEVEQDMRQLNSQKCNAEHSMGQHYRVTVKDQQNFVGHSFELTALLLLKALPRNFLQTMNVRMIMEIKAGDNLKPRGKDVKFVKDKENVNVCTLLCHVQERTNRERKK